VYYVASPEACAAILWKSRDKAATVSTLSAVSTQRQESKRRSGLPACMVFLNCRNIQGAAILWKLRDKAVTVRASAAGNT